METPGYDLPNVGVLINVDMTIPLLRLEHASGRVMGRPYRKVVTFLWTDGPRSTLRKVQSKRREISFTGDYWVAVILGRAIPSGLPVVALGCRVPRAAQQLPVHRLLVREVSDQFSVDDLSAVASSLAADQHRLARVSRQSFLYSAMEPPMELVNLLDIAIDSLEAVVSVPSAQFSGAIKLPAGPERASDTALRLRRPMQSSSLPVALLGAGDYARTEIIPALRASNLSLYCVANREPQIAAMVAREHGFAVATSASERAIAELPKPGLVVVATAHDSHARLAIVAATAGHRAFVEKPPAVTARDVTDLVDTMKAWPGAIEIGFNRRYHPLVLGARAILSQERGPTSIICTIKEVALEPDHWYFWPNQGTRITGNLCHWIDLAVFLLAERPMPVSLTLSPRISDPEQPIDEERVLMVTFEDGSLLTIVATSRGDEVRGVQEQIEIRRGGTTVAIDDLWKMRVRRGGIDRRSRTPFRHKAHADMYRAALRRFLHGEPATYPTADMVLVSAIQIAATELARSDGLSGEIPRWLGPTLHTLS